MSESGIKRNHPKAHCSRCGKIFQKTSGISKYCSAECRNGTGQCGTCFKVFKKRRFSQKTCDVCLKEREDQKLAAAEGRLYVPRTTKDTSIVNPPPKGSCHFCGTMFNKDLQNFSKMKFCNSRCMMRYRKSQLREMGVCQSCGVRDAKEGRAKCALCSQWDNVQRAKKRLEMKGVSIDTSTMPYKEALHQKVMEMRAQAAQKKLDEENETEGGWGRFQLDYDSSSVYYLSDEYRKAEKVKNMHAIMITQCERGMLPRPAWSTKPMEEVESALYDKEGEEIVLKPGQVELRYPDEAPTPRELHRMGVPMSRQVKQWQGRI